MDDRINILESNYYTFVTKVIEAAKKGYLVEDSRRGLCSDIGTLKEITLFKQEAPAARPLGGFSLETYKTQEFLRELAEFVSLGGVVDMSTLRWDTLGLKSAKGTLYLKPEYTKQDLIDMSWDELRDVCKELGLVGRDRTALQYKYLNATGQVSLG